MAQTKAIIKNSKIMTFGRFSMKIHTNFFKKIEKLKFSGQNEKITICTLTDNREAMSCDFLGFVQTCSNYGFYSRML